jgi:phosphate transport system protein
MELQTESGPPIGRAATHTRRSLREFDELWTELLDLAALVRRGFEASVRTLADLPENVDEFAAEVQSAESEVDRWEVRIEQACLRLLALYEPVAIDLRRVAAALRVNGQLERISDAAARIAKRSRKPRAIPMPEAIHELATSVAGQLEACLELLAHPDADRARELIVADSGIDRDYRALRSVLKNSIRSAPDHVNDWLRMMDTARNLERVGDHVVSIADAIIYLKDGGCTRHHGRRPPQS